MIARDIEAALMIRCIDVARDVTPLVQDQREANVFQLAAKVIRSRFPNEATGLMRASDAYFAAHPDERLTAVEVVRKGWIVDLPRLRDRLTRQLDRR